MRTNNMQHEAVPGTVYCPQWRTTARHFLGQSTLLMLYQILLLPQLNYCDIVHDTTTMGNKNKLQVVQNCALRTILKCDNYTPVDHMHNKLEILTLSQRRKVHTATVFS